VRHRLGLATRTQISVCKSPFPSADTAVSLFRAKTVQQRPPLPREVETWLPDCGVTQYCNIVAICRHHPPQMVVLSQICCFWERKVVVFQILLDDDSAEARMWVRPSCLLQSAGGGLIGSSWHQRCRPCA